MAHSKLVQLSDLHLTGSDRPLFGTQPAANLARALDIVRRDHADAAACLLSGDLADDGSDAAYRQLAQSCADLPMPVLVMAGNHDDRAALLKRFPEAGEAGFVQRAVELPGVRLLLLDTLDPGATAGFLCAGRLAWLESQLSRYADPVILAMHHPPLAVGIPAMDQYALRNAEDFWTVIAPHRARIRHLLLGHLHRPLGGSWRGIPISCTCSPNYQVALDFVSLPPNGDVPGCHEPASFAVVLIDDDSVVVHHQALDSDGATFLM